MSDDDKLDDMTALDLIVSLRGGWPENCDFCDKPYGQFVCYDTATGSAIVAAKGAQAIAIQQAVEYHLGWPAWTIVRWPIPEEGGEWACNECYARWRANEVPGYENL
jgi:hypothetical protein